MSGDTTNEIGNQNVISRFLKRLKCKCHAENEELKKRLDEIDEVVRLRTIKLKKSSLAVIQSAKDIEVLIQKLEFMEKFKEVIQNTIPVWQWSKNVVGNSSSTYIDVNDLFIAEFFPGLTREDVIGKTDYQLADMMNELHGEGSFTFGHELCANSDNIVINTRRSTTFTENGKICNEMLFVMVHKNIIMDRENNVVATVGIGRNITEDFTILNSIITKTTDPETKEEISKYLERYHFSPNASCVLKEGSLDGKNGNKT